MTSVPPYRIKVPLLLGGRGRGRAGAADQALGFARRWRATSSASRRPPRCAAA